jgi:pentatricopeptide repeat protein
MDGNTVTSGSETFLNVAYDALQAVSVEIFVFVLALIAFATYGSPMRLKAQSLASTSDVVQLPVDRCAKELEVAAGKGDFRLVLKYWNAIKKSTEPVRVNLAQVIAALQRHQKDTTYIVAEVVDWFEKHHDTYEIDEFNDILDALGRRMDSEMTEALLKVLPRLELRMNSRTCEILLQLYFMLRDFDKVAETEQQMEALTITRTPRVWVVLLKVALKQSDLPKCLVALREMRDLFDDTSVAEATGLEALLSQIAMLGAKEHRTAQVVEILADLPRIPMETMNVLLPACMNEHREDLVHRLVDMMKDLGGVPDADATACLLKALTKHDPQAAKEHIVNHLDEKSDWNPDLVNAVVVVCSKLQDPNLAKQLHVVAKKGITGAMIQVRAAWMRGLADLDLVDEACEIFEDDILRGTRIGVSNEKVLLSLALRTNRDKLSKTLMAASNSSADAGKQVAMIRQCAQDNNMEGAKSIYEQLESRGEANALLSNALLDAMVSCGELQEAEAWMAKAVKNQLTDVVSYNTLLKAYINLGTQIGLNKALQVLKDMPKAEVKPNAVTYNEILNALVEKKGKEASDLIESLVSEMSRDGVEPNHVTASIMLKSLGRRSTDAEVRKAMEMVGKLDSGMDEVLVSSIIEACVRVEKPALLKDYLANRVPSSIGIFGAHTFGSLIKAYGYVGDMNAVWRCWKEMRNRHIAPTPITLGCMVEAVVSNGDTEGAYELIQSMEQDDSCRHHLNSVVYCSVLKGFAREKRLERVLTVFEDMKSKRVVFSIAAFNATIDACARANRMDKLPWLEQEMKNQGVTPNIVTYSTMIKGYATSGDMAKAFSLFDEIQAMDDMIPDEIVYNSLIDGCARGEDYDRGLQVLADMKTKGISPSNFTLSVVIKLCCRCKRLDHAFKFTEELNKEFRLKPNDHVFANLIQACVYCRAQGRALQVFEEMLQKGIRPLPRVYALLLRSAVSSNQPGLVKGLVELAVGARRDLPTGHVLESGLAESQIDAQTMSEILSRLTSSGHEDVADQIFCVVRNKIPGVRLDQKTAKQFLSKVQRPNEPRYRNRGTPDRQAAY